MTTYTLGGLKATIANDLARSDLTSEIADAITNAIQHFKARRFYFNESRTATFPTVAAQSFYGVSDDANIPLWLELDGMFLQDSSLTRFDLGEQSDPVDLQGRLGNGAASGRPYTWAYYNQGFIFYPIPDAAYTVVPMGHIEITAPAADGTVGNLWMTEAYELLRCRAKFDLYAHTIHSPDKAVNYGGLDGDGGMCGVALEALQSKTAKRTGSGTIVATSF